MSVTVCRNALQRYNVCRHTPTEEWLKRHGIRFDKLIMSPYLAFDERDRANSAAHRKAAACQSDPTLHLFVESDDQKAIEIAQATG